MSKKSKKIKPPEEKPTKVSKEEKLFQNISRTVEQFLGGKSYKPLTFEQLQQRLTLPEQHAPLLHRALNQLIQNGVIEVSKNTYVWKQRKVDVVTGILRVHPRGFGFLKADDPTQYPEDIFIPKHLTMNAVDGDTVEVVVNNEVVSEKGPEGKVVSILTRGRTHLAGTVIDAPSYGEILAYAPLLGSSQKIIVWSPEEKLYVGDRIVMEVVEWGSKETATTSRLSHKIGHISDPGCDIPAAIEEFQLRSSFPQNVLEEAQSFGKQVSRKEIGNREDLRELTTFTIDPDTAKDFDDALSLTKDKEGKYHLGVHIADVSYYVQPGSALDKEARIRCNSAYFPGFVVPMLPHELSSNLCSLKANVNRLTASVLMTFDPTGELLTYRITRSVIKSAKRFTYREAKKVLDGETKSVHAPTLNLMVELCGHLKRKRYERGSIEFSLPDLIVLVDEKGVPSKMDHIEYDITHQLVEEFMLKANELVATHLTKQGHGLTYRVHEEPAEENMKDFAFLARAFGYQLSETPKLNELQKMFDEAVHTPYGQYLATSYIRRMRLAVYSPDNIGHFGLGLTHYCHFTSPIRRYVDLVVHRILFGSPAEREHLELVSLNCSDQERISAKAESSVVLLKKLRLLDTNHRQDPRKQYEAVVTKVKPFGIFFEVMEFMIESYLHVSELESDYFAFDEATHQLKGTRHGKNYVSGDRILVMVKEIDLTTQESSWYLVPESTQHEKKEKKPFRKSEKTEEAPVQLKPEKRASVAAYFASKKKQQVKAVLGKSKKKDSKPSRAQRKRKK